MIDFVEKLGIGLQQHRRPHLLEKIILLDRSKRPLIVASHHRRETNALRQPEMGDAWRIASEFFKKIDHQWT